MSKIALSGNPSGTGTFTIASPNSNTNRTLNLPDAAGDVVLTTATQTLTNKSISAAQINSGTLGVARGGTGASTLTANNVLLGNGTSALQAVAPGTSGNVLTSNGTTWTSAAPGGAPAVVNTFNSNGTWTKPATGSMARIQVWGGGGGGARGSQVTANGGGGGGYSEVTVPLSTLGATVSVTIGAGGAGRTSSIGVGTAGGTTSFGSTLSVTGGSGGLENVLGGVNLGGGPEPISVIFTSGNNIEVVTVRPTFFNGGFSAYFTNAINGARLSTGSTYGGGAGGIFDGQQGVPRAAGTSFFGGAGGNANADLTAGSPGTAPGGGGGGASRANGGNGAAGRVIVTVW